MDENGEETLMRKTPEKADESRRNFLKLAATSAPAAAAAATLGAGEAAAETAEAEGTRLRDTAHTRAYFATARF